MIQHDLIQNVLIQNVLIQNALIQKCPDSKCPGLVARHGEVYHRERILETSTLSCNEEEEEITKPPTR